tara:strand:- start:4384 stop:4629 length:246 start_codon:yes stop_codon:yes gene_type:complete
MKESRLRSFLKGLTWRIIATGTIIAIAYFTTSDVELALKIGGLEFVIKLLMYYAHERAWQSIPRGRIRKILGQNKEDKISP